MTAINENAIEKLIYAYRDDKESLICDIFNGSERISFRNCGSGLSAIGYRKQEMRLENV